jgi:hypothetical protein
VIWTAMAKMKSFPDLIGFPRRPGGAFSGQLWKTHSLAPDYREYCRAAVIDVNGDGRPDVILVEDEYPDGRLAWFENRLKDGPETQWTEHPIEAPLNFCHTLRAWHDAKTKQVQVLACEMNEGGWETPYNWNARLILFTPLEKGKSWHSEILYRGEGTHEAVYTDLDGSGTPAIFGHSAQILTRQNRVYTGWVQMFRPAGGASCIFAIQTHLRRSAKTVYRNRHPRRRCGWRRQVGHRLWGLVV